MRLSELSIAAAQKLKADFAAERVDVPVIVVERGDIAAQWESLVAALRVAVVVGFAGAEPVVQGEDGIYANCTIVCQVFERPVENRIDEDAPTLLDVAQFAANSLSRYRSQEMAAPFEFESISEVQPYNEREYPGIVAADVRFTVRSAAI